MATTSITNPTAALTGSVSLPRTVDAFKANAAIGRRKVALWQGPTGGLVAPAGTNANPALFAGIALDAANAGDRVQLVTRGLVDQVPIDGAASVGALLKPGTTAGSLIVAGTPAVGDVVAIAVSAASGGVATVKVL